jgi:hypothetical protein
MQYEVHDLIIYAESVDEAIRIFLSKTSVLPKTLRVKVVR